MDRNMLLVAAGLLALTVLCMTFLAYARVVTGDSVVHLYGVVIGGVLGIVTGPSITNRTSTSALGTVVHTEKVG